MPSAAGNRAKLAVVSDDHIRQFLLLQAQRERIESQVEMSKYNDIGFFLRKQRCSLLMESADEEK